MPPGLVLFSVYLPWGCAYRLVEQGMWIELRRPQDCPPDTAQWVGDGRTMRQLAAMREVDA